MKKRINRRSLLWLGIGLLAVAVLVPVFWQWSIQSAAQKAQDYVRTLHSLLPQSQAAAPEAKRDNTMPALSVEGTDFVGILEMPRFGSELPVGGAWGQVSKYPCRFSGSVYDRSLQIGATSQTGQFDFYREISVGDAVYFTDMEGNRYRYAVTEICYADHADRAALGQEDAALTLFVKNVYAFEYIIIFCDIL